MTSGFSTIAGSVLVAYINLGVPAQNLITSSVMSIPASISISKMRCPETEEPVTRGRVTVDRGESKERAPVSGSRINIIHTYLLLAYQANALHAFSQGAVFGLIVAGQIL
jgi:CNT family concentrative nucleoside transporter